MRFLQESRIAAPPSVVFAFHEGRRAIERLSPPWAPVEVLEGGESLRPGHRVVLRVKMGPIPLRWVAEHTEYEPGRLFADRQVSGPFAFWYHRHLFLDDEVGGTILRDEVEYIPPFGCLGRWLGTRFLEARLRRLFDYRHQMTRRLLETESIPPPTTGPTACDSRRRDDPNEGRPLPA